MPESINIEDTDKVIQDAAANPDLWNLKDVDHDNPAVQRQDTDPDVPSEPLILDTEGMKGNSYPAAEQEYRLPQINDKTVDADTPQTPKGQDPYFQTDNSTYLTEEAMRKGMQDKDKYIDELRKKDAAKDELIKTLASGSSQTQVQQSTPPIPPPQTKEEQDEKYDELVDKHGQAGAIAILAAEIAENKLAARDRQTEQERQTIQGYVDEVRRQNPGIDEATVQAAKNRYMELSHDTNINPLAVLINPGLNASNPGGNGKAVTEDDIQKALMDENGRFKQEVNKAQKRYIPRSPQVKSNPVNKINEVRTALAKKVNEGDMDGALDLAFAQASAVSEETSNQRR